MSGQLAARLGRQVPLDLGWDRVSVAGGSAPFRRDPLRGTQFLVAACSAARAVWGSGAAGYVLQLLQAELSSGPDDLSEQEQGFRQIVIAVQISNGRPLAQRPTGAQSTQKRGVGRILFAANPGTGYVLRRAAKSKSLLVPSVGNSASGGTSIAHRSTA